MTGRVASEAARIETAFERARSFVARTGRDSDRLLLDVALGKPAAALVDACEARQDALGAVAALDADGTADPTSSARALEVLDDARLLHVPCAARLATWWAGQQQPDGSFHRGPERSADDVCSFTASLAARLARSRVVRQSVLDRAGAFLRSHWSVDRVQAGDWATIASLLHFYSIVPDQLADEALRTARAFSLCDADALPGARIRGEELVEALLELQTRAGSFAETGAARDEAVRDTVHGVLALLRLGGP